MCFGGGGNEVKKSSVQSYGPSAGGLAALQNANYWLGNINPANAPLLNVNPANAGQLGAYDYFNSLAANNPFAPYAARATDLFNQGASRPDIEGYLNPYRDAAMEAMKKYVFDKQTREAMGASRSAAGGTGAARSALTAGNLAKAEADATTSAMANYYNSAAQQAFQERANQQGAAYGLGALGSQDVAGRLGIGGAQMSAANNLYGIQMAPNQALYNQQLMSFQTPFQLAGAYAGMAPAYGGTQTGNETTTYPQQSWLGQLGGLIGTGVGLIGGTGGFGSGGWFAPAMKSLFSNRGGRVKHAALGGSMFSGIPFYNQSYRRQPDPGMLALPQNPQAGEMVPNSLPPQADDARSPFAPQPQPASNMPEAASPFSLPSGIPTPTGTMIDPKGIQYGQPVAAGQPMTSLGQPATSNPWSSPFGGLPTPTGTMIDPKWIGNGGMPFGASNLITMLQDSLQSKQAQPQQFKNPFQMARGGVAHMDAGGTAFDDDPEALSQYGRDLLRDAIAAKGMPSFNEGGDNLVRPTAPLSFTNTESSGAGNLNLTGPDRTVTGIEKTGDPDSAFDAIRARGQRIDDADVPPVMRREPVTTPGYAGPEDEGGAPTRPPGPIGGGGGLPALPAIGRAIGVNSDISSRLAANPWMALISAGARMMQGTGRDARGLPIGGGAFGQLLAGLGQGTEAGVKTLQEQREEARKDELARFNAAMQQVPYTQMTAAQRAPYEQMTAAQAAANRIAEEGRALEKEKIDRDRYFPPTISPFADYAIALPKNPGIDKPIYVPLNPDGTVNPNAKPMTEAPPANTSVSPPGGRVIHDDPVGMLTPGTAGNAAVRNPDIGRMYFDPKSRAQGHSEAVVTSRNVDKDAANATALEARAKQIKHNLDVITSWVAENKDKHPIVAKLLEPGATGEERQKILNTMSYFGGKNAIPQDVLAAVNALGKDSILGGFRNITAEGLSAREAQPIIKAAMGAMPSFSLPEQSSRVLVASMEQAAQRQRDRQAFLADFRRKNGNFSTGWEAEFNKQFPPERYVAQAIYSVLPEDRKRSLPDAVKQLRAARDAVITAEKSGDQNAANAARQQYARGAQFVNRTYGGLASYLAFGVM